MEDIFEGFSLDLFEELEPLDFEDTFLVEPSEEIYYDTSEKILKLNDTLSEDIVMENIKEQLEREIDPLAERVNYVKIFREAYESIDMDEEYWDNEYMFLSLKRVIDLVKELILKRYNVELGEDLDDVTSPLTYLEDYETLYEFLFIRNYENILRYINYKLMKERSKFISVYKNVVDSEDYQKDLFLVQSKKKFEDPNDALILHFIREIIDDIISSTTSAFELFTTIISLDKFEEYNNKMDELLLNYGNRIVIHEDNEAAQLYLKPLKNDIFKSEIVNNVLLKYLEGCKLAE